MWPGKLVTLVTAFGLAAPMASAQVPGGKYAIQTFRGNYLTAINGGGITGRPAINTDATRVSGWETFTLVPQSGGLYAIQTLNGNYVTALNGGGMATGDVTHTDARSVNAWEKFAFISNGDGTYAIRTSNGRYVTALNGGGIGGGNQALHTDATQVAGWEKFKLVPAGPACTAGIVRTWSAASGDLQRVGYLFYVLSGNTWASKEVGYGDPAKQDFWGSYTCVGSNTWEFRAASGGLFQYFPTLTLRSDGALVNDQKGVVLK